MKRQLSIEFLFQVFSLVVLIIVVQSVYVTLVRPRANAVLEQQAVRLAEDKSYVPERSWYVVVRDFEQEACFVLMFWGLAILGFKAVELNRERNLLDADLMPVAEGTKILPEDVRKYARRIEALPDTVRDELLPRALLSGLHRFAATGNINDVSTTTQALCSAETERLDSELSMIRYIVWAIPSIGFIGTVRGIGEALGLAYQAVEGDISGVTQSLGVAFNSTFVALLLSLVLMFLVHQFQLFQERLVQDTESYCERKLVRNLAVHPGN
ncbi:MAG: MotA/TolQ/ExbB proton channel family protein [Deltaproteobacteria bacterium]|nr:MotA/TolQ/ExbB proton channel family protein [Deltaproteobacteria bacterium]